MIPDNNILDIIISIVLIYALLSILASIIIEWWINRQKARAMFLKKAIYQLLNDPLNVDFGRLFYSHYLIAGMRNKDEKRPPQYISSRLFAEVLIDVIAGYKRNLRPVTLKTPADETEQDEPLKVIESSVMNRFGEGIKLLHTSPFSETLQSFWEKSTKDHEGLKAQLSFWYDDYMDRVSGWFKYDQRLTFRVIGFLVALALNADSLFLVKVISLDDKLRNQLVVTAEQVAENYQSLSDSAKQNSSELLKLFNGTIPDSTQAGKIPLPGDLLKEKDPARYDQLVKLLNLNDSLSRRMVLRADSVLGIAASLNIPLGWDPQAAPLSWFKDKKDKKAKKGRDMTDQKDGKSGKNVSREETKVSSKSDGILAYVERRNTLSFGNVVYYLLGITITGFMLSFGAPFWFETLVKVINIRRSGKKPDATNLIKK